MKIYKITNSYDTDKKVEYIPDELHDHKYGNKSDHKCESINSQNNESSSSSDQSLNKDDGGYDIKTGATLTDENGRKLSAYEIMRMERIQRNKEYLAKLGLDKNEDGSTLLSSYTNEKKKTRKAREISAPSDRRQSMRRHIMSRRKLSKDVNYSDSAAHKRYEENNLKKNQKNLVTKDEHKAHKDKHTKKVDHVVPKFIRFEMRRQEMERRRNLKAAKKDKRCAEIEYKYAKRRADIYTKKEQRKQANEDRKLVSPLLYDLEKRRWDLIRAKNAFDEEMAEKIEKFMQREDISKEVVAKAQQRFRYAVKDYERILDNILLKRCLKMGYSRESEIKYDTSHIEIKTRDKKFSEMDWEKNSASKLKTVDSSFQIETDSKEKLKMSTPLLGSEFTASKKVRNHNMRNVGGPISYEFSLSLERKWLEIDNAVAASLSTNFIPQVGDIVLYYPCIHHNFLKAHPDFRGKKKRLVLRKPLWERAKDEMFEKLKEVGSNENIFRNVNIISTNLKERTKTWWSPEWISSVEERSSGCYPIICRVEKTCVEFPNEPNVNKESRRKNIKKVKSTDKTRGKREVSYFDFSYKMNKSRRNNRSSIGLAVTLKPLSPLLPPRPLETLSGNSFFDQDALSIPPNFAVLLLSVKEPLFLLPFPLAYESSISLSKGDEIHYLHPYISARQAGKIVDIGEGQNYSLSDSSLALLGKILHHDANLTLSDIHKLEKFISKSYLDKSICKANILPEAYTRCIIRMVLSEYHKRNREIISFSYIQESSSPFNFTANNILELRTPSESMMNIMNWIWTTLPRWNDVKVFWMSKNKESIVSSWELMKIGQSTTHKYGRDCVLPDSLTPLMSSYSFLAGGFIYSLDQTLREKVEMYVKNFIISDYEAAVFVSPVTNIIAPGYECVVPMGMCFRRILRRLKLQEMKHPNHTDSTGKTMCCYYRSTASLLSDLSDIYYNCLLYNNSESKIVNCAYEKVNKLRVIILQLESDRTRELVFKEKLYYRGLLKLSPTSSTSVNIFPKSTPLVQLGSVDKTFNSPLSHFWMQGRYPDFSWSKLENIKSFINNNGSALNQPYWLPQTGDKIVYNFKRHKLFVNGHFSCLAKEQRIIPSMFPINEKKIKKISGGLLDTVLGQNRNNSELSDYWMLGTIIFIRHVFPPCLSENETKAMTFNILSPLLAIGVQFHYKWLSKETHVIYWRPCSFNNSMVRSSEDKVSTDFSIVNDFFSHECKCTTCGLPLNSSFIRAAWVKSTQQLFPRFTTPFTLVKSPNGVSKENKASISKCFDILQERCKENIAFDACDPEIMLDIFRENMHVDTLPTHLQHILSDSESERDLEEASPEVETSKNLFGVKFLPTWCSTDLFVGTRTKYNEKSVYNNQIDTTSNIDEGSLSLPDISLEHIQERIENGFYRCRLSIIHDVEEAFVSFIIWFIKVTIKAGVTRELLEQQLAHAFVKIRNSDRLVRSSEKGEKESSSTYATSNDVCEQSNSTCKLSMYKSNSLSYDQINIKEKSIIKLIMLVRKLYATVIVCISEPNTAETALGLNNSHFRVENEDIGLGKEREIAREKIDSIIESSTPDPCSFRCRRIGNVSYPIASVRVKVNASSIQTADLRGVHKSSYPLVFSDSSLEKNKQPIVFNHCDYGKNRVLTCILFSVPNRKEPCIKCKWGKQGFLHCRLRLAHSNPDYIWIDYLEKVGGVDGLIKILMPSCLSKLLVKSLKSQKHDETYSNEAFNNDNDFAGCQTDSIEKQDSYVFNSLGNVLKSNREINFDSRNNNLNNAYTNTTGYTVGQYMTSKGEENSNELNGYSVNVSKGNKEMNKNSMSGVTELIVSEENAYSKNCANDVAFDEHNSIALTFFAKAELALNIAKKKLDSITAVLHTEPSLGEDFIKNTFPIDPEDGHYEICIICGLSGDILCCETCPNVSHYTCAGLNSVPDGDWYCKWCTHKRECSTISTDISNSPSLDILLNELKILRQKEKNILKEVVCENKVVDDGPVKVNQSGFTDDNKYLNEAISRNYERQLRHGIFDSSLPTIEHVENFTNNHFSMEQNTKDNLETIKEKTSAFDKQLQTLKVGTKLVKQFEQGEFEGYIVLMPSLKNPYFRIRYEDGDEEDLSEDELQQYVSLFNDQRERKEKIFIQGNKSSPSKKELFKCKRGRPSKSSTLDPCFQKTVPKKKRGRPLKRPIQLVDKSGDTLENSSEDKTNESIFLEYPAPIPGTVVYNMKYYCAFENETCRKIAKKLGCESWKELAYLPENLKRYGSTLKNMKTLFKEGTLLCIPSKHNKDKVKALIGKPSHPTIL